MKTVRFQRLVEVAGKPESHLVLVDPAKDRALQSAVKANRIVTVHQSSIGSKTDYGAVGFDPGPSRQFLVFPRGVGRFKARRIVGIKYDLFAGDESPRRAKRGAAEKKPNRKTEKSKTYPPLRALEDPPPVDPAKSKHSRSKKSPAGSGRRAVAIAAKKRKQEERKRAREEQAEKGREKREQEKQARAEARALAVLAAKVRKALEYLEAGKRSPALQLLRRTLQSEL